MKKILLTLIIVFVYSCDPMDDRLVINNNSKDTVVVRMLFDNELPNNPKHWNRSREIRLIPNNLSKIGIFNTWEGEFKRAFPDTLINIIIVPDYDFENNSKKWDSIFKTSNFYQERISLETLKNQDWKIEYEGE